MRKFLILIISFFLIFSLRDVNAEEFTPVSTLEELSAAIANGGNIRLTNNIASTKNLFLNKATTIDLNGNTLNMGGYTLVVKNDAVLMDSTGNNGTMTGTASFLIQVGSSDVPGNLVIKSGTYRGNIYGIRILSGSSLQVDGGNISAPGFTIYNQSRFVLNNGNITADSGLVIQNHLNSTFEMNNGYVSTGGDNVAINFYGSCSGVINDGKIEALYEYPDYGGAGITLFKDTDVTINGGEISAYSFCIAGNGSSSGNSDGSNAKVTINGGKFSSIDGSVLYLPQINGITNISGGEFTSEKTAIEIRAGVLNISGGSFYGNTTTYEVLSKTNGMTTTGAAVSIAQHTTKQPIEVTIIGGLFEAYVPVSFTNPLNNPKEDIDKVKIYIADTSSNIQMNGHNSDDTMVILGKSVKFEIPGGNEVSKNITVEGNEVEMHDIPQRDSYSTYFEIYDSNNKLLFRTTDNKFELPDGDIVVKVKYKLTKKLTNPLTSYGNISFIIVLLLVVATGLFQYQKKRNLNKR